MKGYTHVYTGNGKGKTTAALGLAIRAAGAGLTVFIAQFCKGLDYSELKTLKLLKDRIQIEQYGKCSFIHGEPCEEDTRLATEGLIASKEAIKSGKYDVIILDEVNVAVYFNLISIEDLLDIVDNKPENVELIITGRYAKKELIKKSDLVTRMCEIKHYYKKGIKARKGIEH
ncbi:MAG: cob(I)yrinic acid a,c-diamide adenosyltransferase [Spirochaetota bacterium]|nr:MAG: cob(I)yrinic acid a,c-diamide adenosyltransferase [Spirochaetota bacterium]